MDTATGAETQPVTSTVSTSTGVASAPATRSPALASLLGQGPDAVGVDAYLSGYYPAHHLAVHDRLERLPAFFREGVFADPRVLAQVYRGPLYVTNRTLGRFQVQGVDARDCFEDLGLSVGFTEVEDLAPGAHAWLRQLEADLGMPRGSATIAVFVNAAHSGLSVHCDTDEQIAIHLQGPKAFRVMAHPTAFPRMKHVPGIAAQPEWLAQSPDGLYAEARLPDDAEHIALHPGTVLFTPRGLYHETLAGDDIAMTAVIAFRNPTPAELVGRYLERVLSQSEDWRRPLAFGWSADPALRDAAHVRMARLLAEAGARIGALSLPHLFASAERGARGPGVDWLEDATRLQREPSTRVSVDADGAGRVRLEIGLELGGGESVSCALPEALRPMLAWLAATRGPFTVGDACARFADWDRSAVVSTLASFVRAKALVELPFEAW